MPPPFANALTFPQGDPRRVQLPRFRGPEGLGVWREVCPSQRVPVWNAAQPVAGADTDGYFPIQAVFGYPDCAVGDACSKYIAYANDSFSRCAIYLTSVSLDSGGIIGATPIGMDWQIRASAASIGETLLTGTIVFLKNDYAGTTLQRTGLIAQVSGILGNQYELWGRVVYNEGNGLPLRVTTEFVVDRLGDRFGAYLGAINNGGGGGLPLLNAVAPGP